MLYYHIEGVHCGVNSEEEESGYEVRKRVRLTKQRAEAFYAKKERSGYYFISDVGSMVTLGAITKERIVFSELLEFLTTVHVSIEDMEIKETVFRTIERMLTGADRQGYISSASEILERYGLSRLADNHFFQFGDRILDKSNRETIENEAKDLLINDTFAPELERIYMTKKRGAKHGHPVHYMVETDDRDLRKKTYSLLLQALYERDRLESKRISFFDFDPTEELDAFAVNCLYQSSINGTVVIRFKGTSDTEDGNYIAGGEHSMEQLCEIIKRYRNQVLTVLCLPKECSKVKETLFSELGGVCFVEIKEEFAGGEKAKNYLKMLAKENHVRTDAKLLGRVEEGQKYLAPKLHDMFDEWYSEKLKRICYPQYASIGCPKKEISKKKPKGSAYDELQQMIGLGEAKQVISKALNFYKAQKLFKDKGVLQDRLAMHMVFTGNPGTAKTSVARLFAKIMRDNGLVSKGTFVEVGRGDLVGKYVGWTAKTVQENFKAAIGGVLFIDEAYSLVEDHSGSYGDEAINTIVQEMENHREDVVVIFAGYPDKMEQFLQRNPGLRSRIAFHVPFSDYNTEELCEIADLISKNKGLTLTADARTKLESIFDSAKQHSDFGNGRYVRNVIESARMSQADRILSLDFDEVTADVISTLTADDIADVKVSEKETKQQIGFAVGAA